MNLHEKILALSEKTEYSDLSLESISALTLFRVLNLPYFKGNYDQVLLAQNENNDIVVYSPEVNNIRGATNKHLNAMPIEVTTSEFVEFNLEYFEIKRQFLQREKIDRILQFKKNIEESDSFYKLAKAIEFEQRKDEKFLFTIQQNIIEDPCNNSQSLKNLFQIIRDTTKFDKLEEKSFYKSRLYFNEKLEADTFTFRDILNNGAIKNLVNLEIESSIFKDKINSMSDYYLVTLLRDDHLGKTPKDIKKLISSNDISNYEIFETFRSKYHNNMINIIYNEKNEEKRILKLLDTKFDDIKKQSLDDLNNSLKNIYDLNELVNKYDELTENILHGIESAFPELCGDTTYSIDTIENDKVESMWGTPEAYSYAKKLNKLNIKNCFDIDMYLKGMEFLDQDGFKGGSAYPQAYFFAKTQNDLVGFLSIYKKNNNTLNIGSTVVSNYFRNQGVLTKIYDKMAKYAIETNRVIVSTMYTEMGAKFIPNVKRKLKEKYPELLLLETERIPEHNEFEASVMVINEAIVRGINCLEKPIPMRFLRKAYDNVISEYKKEFDKKEAPDYFNTFDLRSQALSKFNQKLNELQNKKEIKIKYKV